MEAVNRSRLTSARFAWAETKRFRKRGVGACGVAAHRDHRGGSDGRNEKRLLGTRNSHDQRRVHIAPRATAEAAVKVVSGMCVVHARDGIATLWQCQAELDGIDVLRGDRRLLVSAAG